MKLEPDDDEIGYYAQACKRAKEKGIDADVGRLMMAAADDSDPRALYAVATWYLFGIGRKKNFKKAAKMLRVAALAGIARAAFDLAVWFECGKGVTRDRQAAFSLYVLAYTLGDEEGGHAIVRCMYHGIGTRKMPDFAKAIFDQRCKPHE